MEERKQWSTAAMTWPRAWSDDLRSMRILHGIFILGSSVLVLGVLYSGKTLFSAALSWFLVLLVAASIHGFVILSWPKRNRSDGRQLQLRGESAATALNHRPLVDLAYGIVFLLLVGDILWGALIATFVSDDQISGRWTLTARLLQIIGPIVGGVALGRLLLFLTAKRKINGIGLSPAGLYHWSWGICSFYTWDSIRDFAPRRGGSLRYRIDHTDAQRRHGVREETRLGRLGCLRRRRQAEVQLGLLPVHPALAYQALFFYLQHPECRQELGTDAAAERLRTGDFPEIIEQIEEHGRALSKREADRRR